jgi:hypothetical protein
MVPTPLQRTPGAKVGLNSSPTAAPPCTPRSSWIEERLRALATGGPDAIRIDPLARAPSECSFRDKR